MPLLVMAQFLFGIGLTVFNVNQAGFRQAIAPERFRGRATATSRVLVTALISLGAILGDISGDLIGLRSTLVVAAVGEFLAALWIWNSPLRRIQDLPAASEEIMPGTP